MPRMSNHRLTKMSLFCLLLAATGVRAADCQGIEPVLGDDLILEPVASGLVAPVDIQAPAGDTARLFVVEQTGTIRIIRLADGSIDADPFLNLDVACCDERGLLGLAFHPNYAENGFFFVNYIRPAAAGERQERTVIARFQVSAADPDRAEPTSKLVLLEIAQTNLNHNAGQLAFSPVDGYLYIGTGDGGGSCDPVDDSQRPSSLLGKMLRLDVDDIDPQRDPVYGIPASNPFVDDAQVPDEIWAVGLRNPWRYAFDSETGDLYIGDVGQWRIEEIDFQSASSDGGENYGWRTREGDQSSSISGCSDSLWPTIGQLREPIYVYGRSNGLLNGCSVTGGVVYRGCRMPDLVGSYFFADFCDNWIASFRYAANGAGQPNPVSEVIDRTSNLLEGVNVGVDSISTFGTDGAGEMYIATHGSGLIMRIAPRQDEDQPPHVVLTLDPGPVVELSGESVSVTLDASGSTDGDDGTSPLSFSWQKESGPEGGAVDDPDAPSTSIEVTVPGTYRYRLTVDDGNTSRTVEILLRVVAAGSFVRGDANSDGSIDISDGIFTLQDLFGGALESNRCRDALDSNDDGGQDISDAIFTLNFLFTSGAPIPPPNVCGPDSSADAFGCEVSNCPLVDE